MSQQLLSAGAAVGPHWRLEVVFLPLANTSLSSVGPVTAVALVAFTGS